MRRTVAIWVAVMTSTLSIASMLMAPARAQAPPGDSAGPAVEQPAGTAPGDIALGEALLHDKCSRCHAIGAQGESAHTQAPPFRMIVTRYAPSDLAEALAEGIVSGHPDMPVFEFQPREIDAIIGYLDGLKAAQ